MIRVASEFEVNAPAERVMALLSETRKLPLWVPGVTAAEVLAREGDISVIELAGSRLRHGRLVLECVTTSSEEIVFAEVDRWRGRGVSGSISVRDRSEGCLLGVVVRRDGMVLDFVAKRRVRQMVDELASELKRRAERPSTPELEINVGRRKILEIVRRDGRLYVQIEGNSVELPTSSEPMEAS